MRQASARVVLAEKGGKRFPRSGYETMEGHLSLTSVSAMVSCMTLVTSFHL